MIDIPLDNTRQKDLYEKACQDMARQIPGWTDAFPSDPTVALLEHLSSLSDMQNYILDQVTDAHYLAYCNLLGATPRRRMPAQVVALPDPAVPCQCGDRFQISGVPFEVTEEHPSDLPQITQVVLQAGSNTRLLQADHVLALEENPPCSLHIRLSGLLPTQETPLRFWVSILPEAGRNPPSQETAPPVQLHAHIRTGEQWKTVPCIDGTCGFLQSGFVSVLPTEETDAVLLRIHGVWEGVPQLQRIVLEPVIFKQQHTRSACMELTAPFSLPRTWQKKWELFYFTPCEDGWQQARYTLDRDGQIVGLCDPQPETIRVVAAETDFHAWYELQGIAMEELVLEEENLLPDTLRVMVEENGRWYDCPVCLPEPGKTLPRGCRWEPQRHAIRFGDGRDYLPPVPGRALVCGCILSVGSMANGAKGTLIGDDGAPLTVLNAACGGQNEESPKEAFDRAAREQEQPLRAVTCEDYERLARCTPGLALEQVQAIPKTMLGRADPGIVVLVKPCAHCEQPTLSPWQKRQLAAFLEPYRLLGVPLEVRGPRYCPIRVQTVLQTVEPIAQEKLRGVLLPLTDGVHGTLDFGAEISYTALYTALCSMDSVRSVRKLELMPLARGIVRASDGSIRPAPDMLPYLAELDIIQSQ